MLDNRSKLIVAAVCKSDTVCDLETFSLLTLILDLGDDLSYETLLDEFFCKNSIKGYPRAV